MHRPALNLSILAWRGSLLALLAGLPLAAQALERPTDGYYSQPRVHFAFVDEAPVRLDGRDFTSPMKWDYADVETLLRAAGATDWNRLFDEHSIAELDALRKTGEARRGTALPDLNNWYTVVVPSDAVAATLAAELAKNPRVRSAEVTKIPTMNAVDLSPTTPSWAGSQGYQSAAPTGVGIAAAWAESGGDGQGVRILHCEGGWIVDHEDFDLTYTGGGNSTDSGWWNHGTACVSILGARQNAYGVTGMTPNLDGLFCRGIFDAGSPNAWISSTNYVDPGDVISASWGYGGSAPPGQVCVCNCAQFGGQPAESDQADFDAIQTITANGYIVVNSASNGSISLDDPYYGGMYDLNVRDSGALLIGAIDPGGAPTCWTNYGSRVDAHAWGSAVYSAGYGDLFTGGGDTRQYYTSDFGGTSSACPIVSGSVAALQGVYKASHGGAVLDSWQLRELLRSTGTDQTGDFGKNVSNMPDLVQLIAAVGGGGPDVTPPSISHQPLGNTGDETGPYVVAATIIDASGVVSAAVHHRTNGGAWSQTAMVHGAGSSWTGSIPGESAGSVIDYYITAVDGADTPNAATGSTFSFTVLTSTEGIVLLTPSTSARSGGLEWELSLTAAGYPGTIMNVDDLDGVVLGPQTDALVVLLGVYSSNFVVPAGDPMATAIEDFVDAGGNVYMEGGDCWAYDPGSGGHDFGPLFGVDGLSDGTGDLASATGHGPLSASYAYSGENAWIDHLGSAGASLLFDNPGVGYDCGFYQTGARTTACTSFELAGLSNFTSILEILFGPALFDVFAPDDPPLLSYDPLSIDSEIVPGGMVADGVVLANLGGQTLQWTASTEEDPFAARPQRVWPSLELAKDEADPRPGILPNAYGGPDAFGYRWTDSDEPDGPAVAFQDISGTGTPLALGDDQTATGLAVGFPFSFYGMDYTTVNVCSNGWLSFTSTANSYSNAPMPTAAEPNALLAAFWDDLNPTVGGTVHWQAFPDRFVVQWTAVPRYSNGAALETFQVVLGDDDSIEFQYQTVSDATSATVGIENADGTVATQVVYNAAYLRSNFAVRFATEPAQPSWLWISDSAGSIAPGGDAALSVVMDASQLAAGTYTGRILLGTNEPGSYAIPVTLVVGTPDTTPPVAILNCLQDTYSTQPRPVSASADDESGVAWMDLVYRVDGGAWQSLSMTSGAGSAWTGTLPGQPAFSTVEFHIVVADVHGNQAFTGDCDYDVLGLGVPDLAVTLLSGTAAQATWTAVPGATSYNIYVADGSDLPFMLVASTSDTQVVFGISPELIRLVRVTAVAP